MVPTLMDLTPCHDKEIHAISVQGKQRSWGLVFKTYGITAEAVNCWSQGNLHSRAGL